MKITLQYKCRRCGSRFYDPTITYLQNVKQIQETPALMTMIHECDDIDSEDNSERFGICDLIGCKVEK
jgi:DNA-directed RNA polymerase subunit RPC12/RpoP